MAMNNQTNKMNNLNNNNITKNMNNINNVNNQDQLERNNYNNQTNQTHNNSSNKKVNISSYSNSNTSNSKITFNNNSGKTAGRSNNPNFRPLSDSRLYEMANQYITTDESLEKFQTRLKNKYGNIYTSGVNPNSNLQIINERNNYNENSNFNNREKQGNSNQLIHSGSLTSKNKRPDRLSKNIASNLEYYKIIES